MTRQRDDKTLSMFARLPSHQHPMGTLNISHIIPNLVSEAIKESGIDRFEIAARMSRLTGEEIAKSTIDAWSSTAKRKWRFPLELLPAFEAATATHVVSQWLAERLGGQMLYGQEVLEAQLGRFEMLRRDADAKYKQIRSELDRVRGQS